MNTRKIVAGALALLLLAGVAGGVWYSGTERQIDTQARISQAQHATVTGLIGSEKEAFFNDPRVKAVFERNGLTVHVEKAGSRAIAQGYDPKRFDFGFPSGSPAAVQIKKAAKASNTYSPFYTPIVFASWRPVADILVANGVATKEGDFYYLANMPQLMDLVSKGARWRDLKSSAAFSTNKAVLPSSTDVRTSNSAAMYLSLASYIANGQQVVQSQDEVQQVLPKVTPLFMRQGFQEASSSGPFEDYLALGMGKAPLLVIYESQMVEHWLRHRDKRDREMVIVYPKPTIFSKHVLVPFTPKGDRVGQLLEKDPTLLSIANEYGFRTGGSEHGPETWAKSDLKVPTTLVDVIDPPSQEWLERLIVGIEKSFN